MRASLSTPDRTVFGAFVIIIGGLLGGWRLGLGLGTLGMLVSGSLIYFLDARGATLAAVLRGVPPDVPVVPFWLGILSNLVNEFGMYYILNLRASMSVWVGLAAGLAGGWLRDAWLVPGRAFALGASIDLAAGMLILPTAMAPPDFLTMQIASALLTGLGLSGFALIIRSVRAEAARHKATEAELAAARAELRALRAQVKPHFLFSALNTIRYFVRTEPDTARQL